MRVERVVTTDKPLDLVYAYLSDFTNTTEWDPGTVSTEKISGDGGVGTAYRNVSSFLGRQTELTYTVIQRVEGKVIALRGVNKTVTAQDTMSFAPAGAGGTQVTYSADFEFSGVARFLAPILRPALDRLGDHARDGMTKALAGL
ncbi:MAG: SRPBCC family protein [Lapillicoccus sp.]